MNRKLECPRCGGDGVEIDVFKTYFCKSCLQIWGYNFILVQFPDNANLFEENESYPCFNSEDNGACYVTEYEYIRKYKKRPQSHQYYNPIPWPDSQSYLEYGNNPDSSCELINDEKGLNDFGTSSIWVPCSLIKLISKNDQIINS